MSKEVNITLKTSLDDIPAEVAELLEVLVLKLEKELDNLKVVTNNIANSRSVSEYGHALVDMEGIRRGLYKIDNRVEDTMGILAAYQQHISGAPQQPSQEDFPVAEEIVANYD
jgi:hypothetical protein